MAKSTPELLSPAGSPSALRAAIEGGADAIYLGGTAFNARINAKNFTPDDLREGIELAHEYGARIYIAANTLIYDREREDFLRAAEEAYLLGADALIVADIGAAHEIKKRIPIELHASTQLSGHNVAAAKLLASMGFSRMVCAREMSEGDLRIFCKDSPIEAEVFVHGALCVSTSGQCLFSSVVGGRSGNRGECAQPCRLPYTVGGREAYPLSLKDLSLAAHLSALCDMGVASLKIEGRMKSPEYVRDVTAIFRRLLDEGRDANEHELDELARIFSRGGFTDGYFTKKTDKTMLGVRSQGDKEQSRELVPFDKITRRLPIEMSAKIKLGEPMSLTVRCGGREEKVVGEIPQAAINAPLTEESVRKNLAKLGATPYTLSKLELELDERVIVPISALNALRRAGTDALKPKSRRSKSDITVQPFSKPTKKRQSADTALFYSVEALTSRTAKYFERIFVPLEQYAQYEEKLPNVGVMLPEVIFDSQADTVRRMLADAYDAGARDALVCNLGHIELAKEYGFAVHGDHRLNICNASSAYVAELLGEKSFILSPELTAAQIRDIGGESYAVVYGRLPLMLTEKCVGRELGGCNKCNEGAVTLTDRRGVKFPVIRRFEHRSLIVNSVPTYMADKWEVLDRNKITARHFIFTTERNGEGAVEAYRKKLLPSEAVRRIK